LEQQVELAVDKAINTITEKILLQESHGWNGVAYEAGYQKGIEDVNLLILSLKPQIMEGLRNGN
jgi:hypothetical protein